MGNQVLETLCRYRANVSFLPYEELQMGHGHEATLGTAPRLLELKISCIRLHVAFGKQ